MFCYDSRMKTYTGSCHCGAVAFEAEADLEHVLICNCSHCHKKGFILNFIDNDKFTLLRGADNLGEYFFNKKSIRHLFCKTCGVQAYAEGVTFPKIALNVRCLDGVDIYSMKPELFNGKDI